MFSRRLFHTSSQLQAGYKKYSPAYLPKPHPNKLMDWIYSRPDPVPLPKAKETKLPDLDLIFGQYIRIQEPLQQFSQNQLSTTNSEGSIELTIEQVEKLLPPKIDLSIFDKKEEKKRQSFKHRNRQWKWWFGKRYTSHQSM